MKNIVLETNNFNNTYTRLRSPMKNIVLETINFNNAYTLYSRTFLYIVSHCIADEALPTGKIILPSETNSSPTEISLSVTLAGFYFLGFPISSANKTHCNHISQSGVKHQKRLVNPLRKLLKREQDIMHCVLTHETIHLFYCAILITFEMIKNLGFCFSVTLGSI